MLYIHYRFQNLFLEFHGVVPQTAQGEWREDEAERDENLVPPVGDHAAASFPQCFKTSAGARLRRHQCSYAQTYTLPTLGKTVEVGRDACRTHCRNMDTLIAHLLGECDRETFQISLACAIQRQSRERHPNRE